MPDIRKAPTIQDVARHANVSTATVSRSLSAPERVSAETRAKVSEAVRVTGYTLNQAGRSLRQRSARTILVALPDIRNPFFSSILDAIEREASHRGLGVLVANLYLGSATAPRLQDYMLSNRADGLILLDGSIDPETLRMLASEPYSVPLVVACEDIPDRGFHTVLTDNLHAARRATQHLIDFGHHRIGHLMGPAHNIIARERLLGFGTAMREAGLCEEPRWQFRGNFDMESGFAAAQRFLSLEERPTAIFAANDETAIGFISGLRAHGIVCPRDLSIVAFDDIEVAAHYEPPLTTMRQPREALGRLAAQTLIDILEGEANRQTPLHIVLKSELIVRGSTARLLEVARA